MRHQTSGDILREAREKRGSSLQDVAARTKIRVDYLRALEEGDYAALPERPFARSYLQRYAADMGLEAAPLLADFDRSHPTRAPQVAPRQSGNAARARRGNQVMVGAAALLSGVLVLAVLGWGGYATWQSRQGAQGEGPAAVVPLPTERQIQLSVSSAPAGAEVFLDNRLLGKTPVKDFPMEAREQGELRVELPGHKPVRQTVPLTEARQFKVEFQGADAEALSTLDGVEVSLPVVQQETTQAGTVQADAPAPAAQPPASQPAAPAVPPPVTQPPPDKPDPAPARVANETAAAGKGVTLRFTGRSWVRVSDANGTVLYQGIPSVGSERQFPAGVMVRAGSAGEVQVLGAGGARPLGQSGQVVELKVP